MRPFCLAAANQFGQTAASVAMLYQGLRQFSTGLAGQIVVGHA
jgi:hypothetical protein